MELEEAYGVILAYSSLEFAKAGDHAFPPPYFHRKFPCYQTYYCFLLGPEAGPQVLSGSSAVQRRATRGNKKGEGSAQCGGEGEAVIPPLSEGAPNELCYCDSTASVE